MKPNGHGIPGAAGSLARRFALGVLIALLVADGLASGAQAYTTQMWNTMALFNGGTKTSTSTMTDTCENVTANALQLNNTGNYQGIGLTTGTSTCATGAWGVNPSGLVLAYDMQTLTSGSMEDFSPSVRNGVVTALQYVTDKFGKGSFFNDISSSVIASDAGFPTGANPSTVVAWLNTTSTLLKPIVSFGSIFVPGRHTRDIFQSAAAGNHSIYFSADSDDYDFSPNLPTISDGLKHFILVSVKDATHIEGCVDLSCYNATLPNPLNTLLSGQVKIGSRVNGTSLFWRGTADEVLIFNRLLTPSEITGLRTDGRSSFLSSGSWTSPNVAFTTAPASVTLTGTSFTSSNRPSRLRFLSSSGTVVFDTLVPSGLASPIQIPVNLTFNPAQWSVRLDMIGNGAATAKMTSILVTLGAAPLFQTSDIIFIFGILLLVFALFFLLPEGGEFGLISLVCAMGFVLWSFLYFYAQSGNVAYSVITIGLGVMVGFLSLGKIISEAAG